MKMRITNFLLEQSPRRSHDTSETDLARTATRKAIESHVPRAVAAVIEQVFMWFDVRLIRLKTSCAG